MPELIQEYDEHDLRLARALIAEMQKQGLLLSPAARRADLLAMDEKRITLKVAAVKLAEKGYEGWGLWKLQEASRRLTIRSDRSSRPVTVLLSELMEDIPLIGQKKEALKIQRLMTKRRGRPRGKRR